jgi:hypothetical protein
MHDIDARIREISGTNNYMEHLQKVTGDIFRVDMDLWKEKHAKICTADRNVVKLLAQIKVLDSNITKIHDEYKQLSDALSLPTRSFQEKVKRKKSTGETKTRMYLAPGYAPKDLVRTKWFKQITFIENSIQKYLSDTFTDAEHTTHDFMHVSFSDLQTIYDKHPDLVDIKLCLGVRVNNAKILQSIVLIKRACKDVINILLVPMYDVEQTIHSHWNQIDRIFKNKTFQQHAQGVTPSDVINILHKFIIAKYRADVTGNNKHYVKLFFGTIGDETMANMDGARFMEIMDSIDMSAFDKDDKVYKFATNAKTIMQKIAKNETLTPKMLEEITQMMDMGGIVDDVADSVADKPSKKGTAKKSKKGVSKQDQDKVIREEVREIDNDDAEIMMLDADLDIEDEK